MAISKQRVTADELPAKVKEARAADPATVVYLAVDNGSGKVDRAPILQDLWDRLRDLGVAVNFVGKPKDAPKPAS